MKLPVSNLNPDFRRFWQGETASTLAFQMLMVAMGWQMYEITNSPLSLGLVGLTHFASQLIFTLSAGHVADRYDRRRVAGVCQILQAAVAVWLAAGSHAGWLNSEGLYIASFLIGTGQAFQSPSIRALLSTLVDRPSLPAAIAWSSAARKAAIITGPALGGVMYLLGPSVVYAATAVSFVAAGALLVRIRAPTEAPSREPVTLPFMFGGVTYIRSNPVVLGAMSLDLFATLLGGATALLPIYARDILETGPWGLGLLRAAPAVGALLISVYLVRSPFTSSVGRIMFASVAAFGVATIVFGLSRSLPLSLAALMVLGAADMVSVVIRSSLIQLETPDEMRGRVSAVNSLFNSTANQLGQFESGLVAAWLGTVPSVVIGGVGTLLIVGLWMKLFPSLVARQVLATRNA
jgi:MFS family permease